MNTTIWIAAGVAALALTAGTLHFSNSAAQVDAAGMKAKSMASAPLGQTRPVQTGAGQTGAVQSQAVQGEVTPVVVEFFTSQGCSSCPPADRLAAKLAQEEGLLVIERPVTYWDRLGWRDTLGQQANTDLQRAYAQRGLAGRNGVYTPQAVVGGRGGVVGSREDALRTLVGQTRHHDAPQIDVAKSSQGTLKLKVEGASTRDARLQLVGLDRSETVKIGRGENGGRRVTYTNVWKGERPLGTLNGGVLDVTLNSLERDIPGANAYAVIVREGPSGPVLAGRMLPPA